MHERAVRVMEIYKGLPKLILSHINESDHEMISRPTQVMDN